MKVVVVLALMLGVGHGSPVAERAQNQLLELTGTSHEGAPCLGIEIVSCQVAKVNWEMLMNLVDITLPTGDTLLFHTVEKTRALDPEAADPVTVVYRGLDNSTEALLTYKQHTLYGRVTLEAGKRHFVIETLPGDGLVVWAEINQGVWNDERRPLVPHKNFAATADAAIPQDRMRELLAKARQDTTTMAEYTVTVYYTKTFKDNTADPHTFIDQVVAETNQGYKNSGVALRMRLHCVQQSDVADGQDSSITLEQFTQSKASTNDLRLSADVTILLVNAFTNGGTCGVNWFDTIQSGQTIGTVAKSCALGYFSFGHEIAHGFGLAHDRRVASTSSKDYAYGYIIQLGKFRTIMAYATNGETRVNYYSSPLLTYNGMATGNAQNDNLRRLVEIRFAAAKVGDESMACPAAPSSATLTATTGGSGGQTAVQCTNKYRNCKDVVSSCWLDLVATGCPSTCGLCPGQTPVTFVTCYNQYSNCGTLASMGYCNQSNISTSCRLACGIC